MSWMISNALMKAYENSHFSRVREGGFWAESSLDGAPSAQSNENHTPLAYLCSDKMTAFSTRSLSGMTFATLTADRGEGLLTWYLEGFLAKTSAWPERAQDSTGKGPGSGPKWPASLARLDPVSSSWRIHQCSLFGEGYELLQTLPVWGTWEDGELWGDSTHRVTHKGKGCGYLPAPQASDAKIVKEFKALSAFRNWKSGGQVHLPHIGLMNCVPLSTLILATEKTMDWIPNWTELKPLAMDKYQQWLNSHGKL